MALSAEKPEYRAVAVDTLQPNRVPPIELFIQRDGEDPQLLQSRTLPVNRELLQNLNDHGVRYLYLTPQDFEIYEKYLNRYLGSIINDPKVPIESKCDVTYDLSSQFMQRVYESSNPAEVVQASQQVVNMVIDVIFQDKKASHNFLLKTSMDFALYTHSVNVCMLGVSLAREALGISKQEAMELYGPGLLLHDIGMTTVPKDIYDKVDPLTGPDIEEIRKHPEQGYEIVKEFTELPKESEYIILCHHERLDGSGYPEGLKGDDIPIGAKICAIVDVFDSLNTQTPYRDRLPSFEALKEMKKGINHLYDEHLYKKFLYIFLTPND